ncbi:dna polymerase [Stylonychia lemnae]|uniref:DNA-directed DNA polymerase n=1 Tax=Stylonychia lemnae TaxID=5949 RepID=A0A078AQV7_STYLE|nr:dna polymerase [Stylonychia lemnae]|eukprot:CDW83283.1 dna polymerase [Stylonychia lemnae]
MQINLFFLIQIHLFTVQQNFLKKFQQVKIKLTVKKQLLLIAYALNWRKKITFFDILKIQLQIFLKKYVRCSYKLIPISVGNIGFMTNKPKDKNKNTIFEHNYIKNSYFGGRCEVFGNPSGKKKIHHFDFTGMYSQCFHTIKFKCDDYIPFLPYRGEKLLFPKEHYSSLVYEKKDFIFRDFIDIFVDIRKKGIYYKIFGKNMNNGLYGSFAMNEEDEEYVVCMNDQEFESYRLYTEIKSFFKYKKRNVAYAAVIASKARIKLNNALIEVLKDGGELYYTDTDSIFAGYDESKLNCALGEIV